MAEARFTAVLEDSTSGAASSVVASMQRMKSAIQGDLEQIKALQSAMRNLKGPGAQNTEQFKAMSDQLTALKASVQSNTSKFLDLGGSAGDLAAKGSAGADSLMAIMNATKGVAGPMGGLFEKFNLLKGAFTGGAGAAAGWAVAVVAVIAVAVAAVAVIAEMWMALGKLAFQMAQFALESSSAEVKVRAVMVGLTGSAGAAKELGSTIDRVAGQVPIAASEVSKLAQDLYKSGKRGAELEDALFKASMKAAGLGDKVKKGSEAARLAMLPLEVQTAKFKENITNIFKGVNTDSFLGALQDVLSIFDTSTSSGKALKALVGTILDPLFSAASTIGPYVKMMFRGMVVGALLLAVGVLKVRNALASMIPKSVVTWMSKLTEGTGGLTIAFYAGIAVVGLLVLGLIALVAATALVAAAFVVAAGVVLVALGILLAPILTLGVLMVAVGLMIAAPFILAAVVIVGAFALIAAAVYYAYDALSSVDFGAIGSNMMSSLANAISSGASWVMDALTSLASRMGSTIKSALGIASPSKLFASMGEFTALGMAEGIESETPTVAGAVQSMVEPPATQEMSAAGAAAGGSGGGGKVSITIPFAYAGKSKAEEAETRGLLSQFCEVLETALEEGGIDATLVVA